jgi:hypothetical protein
MGGECSTHGENRNVGNLKGRNNLEEMGGDGKIL